jgi:hypothetical protein
MTQKENNWMPIAIIGAIVIIAIFYATGYITFPAQSMAGNVDLRNLYSKYNLGELETLCKSLNGDWHQETGWIGCTAVQGTTINCNMPLLITAKDQCDAVNATWYCDSGSAQCKY